MKQLPIAIQLLIISLTSFQLASSIPNNHTMICDSFISNLIIPIVVFAVESRDLPINIHNSLTSTSSSIRQFFISRQKRHYERHL